MVHKTNRHQRRASTQEGKLGTIAPGACADLRTVGRDPLTDVRVTLNPEKNLKFIMKREIIYKAGGIEFPLRPSGPTYASVAMPKARYQS